MAKFKIISADRKTLRFEGCPKYVGTHLGVPYLEFADIESPTPINWQRGDFVVYSRTGLTYRLYSAPLPKKQARTGAYGAAFVYSNVKLYSAVKDLEIALFRDVVKKDNGIHFSTRADVSTFEDVYGIASRIQECVDDLFPGKWEIAVLNTADADLQSLFAEKKDFSVSNGTCLDALSQIYETWKNVGWIHTYDSANDKNIITIGRSSLRDETNTTDAYALGVNYGLRSIKKASANEGEFATRLYVYGSERNIQTRYYNTFDILNKDSVDIRNLMIPLDKWGKTDGKPDASKAYVQASDDIVAKYGLIPRIVYFDGSNNEEVYPSISGLTFAEVRRAMQDAGVEGEYLPKDLDTRIDTISDAGSANDIDGSKEATEASRTFTLVLDSQIGFNLVERGALTSEGYATISMKSGACAGRNFIVRKQQVTIDNRPILTLEREWDESVGMGYPNSIYPLSEGDQFVLLDIPMPDFYITLAQERLYDKALKMLADYTRVSAYYEPEIDSIAVTKGNKVLREGMFMQVYDKDVVDTENSKDYVLIDTLTIDEDGALPKYEVTLREQKRSSRSFGVLEEMIEDAKHDAKRDQESNKDRFKNFRNDYQYLREAFDQITEGEVFLGDMMGVGAKNGEDDFTINAFLNGDERFKYPDGTLMLATGIPESTVSGNTNLQFRAYEATTRIFDKGKIVTNDIEAKGGKIGAFAIKENGNLVVDDVSTDAEMILNENGITFYSNGVWKPGSYARLGNGCEGGVVLQVIGDKTKGGYCHASAVGQNVGIHVMSDKAAIFCDEGMYYGLRPKTESSSAETFSKELSEFDHTEIAKGPATYILPDNPPKGQCYRIIKAVKLASMTIQSNSADIYDLISNASKGTAFTVPTNVRMLEIVWDGESTWFVDGIAH